ncbi:MAG: hypothetical protein JO093_03700 [Acidobacteria bacterium]|nr:hypothetical protein [Acidobacteriota bacterium]MBV9184695.1 hypothetical protein [Acidobacteriota bacterium]
MTSQVVFLSLFLGLTAGPHMVELQVGPGVHTVRMLLDNRGVAVLNQPPWRATVEFGSSIVPSELVAIAYDAKDNEIARVTQLINVPRPVAEFNITLQNDAAGVPATAQFQWEHLIGAKAASATLTVDGKPVAMDKSGAIARLPRLDMKRPHLITGEMKFEDGFVTRRELVVGGELTGTMESEMTPIAVRQSGSAPANPGDCFTSGGAPIRVGAIENSPALVVFVIDPDPEDPLRKLNPQRGPGLLQKMEVRHLFPLDRGTTMRVLFPIAERHSTTNNATAELFPPSNDVPSDEGGLIWFLTRALETPFDQTIPRQLTDAVGVAGLNAITGAHRRAVVLVLSGHADASTHSAASVRSYLAAIGVPLFVWSGSGPRPDMRAAWGEIDDISSRENLKIAADRLRAELASQRVAWVATDPVTALRLRPTGKCAITPLASQ